jgi:hypothetical protein
MHNALRCIKTDRAGGANPCLPCNGAGWLRKCRALLSLCIDVADDDPPETRDRRSYHGNHGNHGNPQGQIKGPFQFRISFLSSTSEVTNSADCCRLMASPREFPPVNGQDILNCSFSSWYAKYNRLSLRARIIRPLPEEFLAFLKSDGIVIPGEYAYTNEASLIEGKQRVYSRKSMKLMARQK